MNFIAFYIWYLRQLLIKHETHWFLEQLDYLSNEQIDLIANVLNTQADISLLSIKLNVPELASVKKLAKACAYNNHLKTISITTKNRHHHDYLNCFFYFLCTKSDLENLILQNFSLNDFEASFLSLLISELEHLKMIMLDNMDLTQAGMMLFWDSIGHHQNNFECINTRFNQQQLPETWNILFRSIQTQTNLKKLLIELPPINPEMIHDVSFNKLISCLKRLRQLEEFSLRAALQFSPEQSKILIEHLADLPKLKQLIINGLDFSDICYADVEKLLNNLSEITLNDVNINTQMCLKILQVLPQNKTLETLNIQSRDELDFSQEAFQEAYIDVIEKNSSLRNFRIISRVYHIFAATNLIASDRLNLALFYNLSLLYLDGMDRELSIFENLSRNNFLKHDVIEPFKQYVASKDYLQIILTLKKAYHLHVQEPAIYPKKIIEKLASILIPMLETSIFENPHIILCFIHEQFDISFIRRELAMYLYAQEEAELILLLNKQYVLYLLADDYKISPWNSMLQSAYLRLNDQSDGLGQTVNEELIHYYMRQVDFDFVINKLGNHYIEKVIDRLKLQKRPRQNITIREDAPEISIIDLILANLFVLLIFIKIIEQLVKIELADYAEYPSP